MISEIILFRPHLLVDRVGDSHIVAAERFTQNVSMARIVSQKEFVEKETKIMETMRVREWPSVQIYHLEKFHL